MNYIKHLTAFFERVAGDSRLNATHISVYISLFQFWNVNRFQNPISVARSEVMRVSKISAKATYHKVIKQLHEFGYIHYKPSFNPYKGSSIHLIEFKTASEQVMNGHQPKSETASEQVASPYINNTNSKNLKQGESTHTSSDFDLVEKPTEEQVREYFMQQKARGREAEKFFNHYQSNGWLVGRTPMKDWQAAARKWILNTSNFTNHESPTRNLNSPIDKDYSEPL